MLNSAADYVYNAANLVADGVVIRGRIIPTEDIAGQPHPLRRENFAYLSEALSERLRTASWLVPGQYQVPWKSDITAMRSAISALYNGRNFAKPGATLAAKVAASTSSGVPSEYAADNLGTSDFPSTWHVDSSNYMYADDLRNLFYAVNQLQRKWEGTASMSAKTGAVSLDAVVWGYDSDDPQTQTKIPYSIQRTENVSGTTAVTFTGDIPEPLSPPSTYRFVMQSNCLYSFSTHSSYWAAQGQYSDRWEMHYSGSIGATFTTPPSLDDPQLFVNLTVDQGSGSASGGSRVIYPLSTTVERNSDDEIVGLSGTVDLTTLRAVVSMVFPNASFSIGSYTDQAYRVLLGNAAVLDEKNCKSILPTAWGWRPT